MNEAAIFMQNRQERLDYLNREMAIMDYESDKDAWIEEGKAEGRAEGRAEGIEEGRAEGRAEGMAEGEKAADRRTAMRMLQKNKPMDEILELVDLTRTEIEELAHDMKKM